MEEVTDGTSAKEIAGRDKRRVGCCLGILCVTALIGGAGFVVTRAIPKEVLGPENSPRTASTTDESTDLVPTPTSSRMPASPSDELSHGPRLGSSNTPSSKPSKLGSSAPTISNKPSLRPSAGPTRSPTTARPTLHPSSTPSTPPSIPPSSSPTRLMYPLSGFYVMGDTPYAPWEELVLQQQVRNMTALHKEHILFTAHVGDMQKPDRTDCEESAYAKTQTYLKAGPVATFVLAGDNDYADCPDSDEAFDFYSSYFNYFEDIWQHNLNVSRNVDRPELFAFEKYGILYIGIHLLNVKPDGGSALREWNGKLEASIEWFSQSVAEHSANLRGIVIFGHALRSRDTLPFFEGIKTLFLSNPYNYKVPVLYLHGDGHKWEVDLRLSSDLLWGNIWNVQVDQGAFADPCIVEVAQVIDGQMVPLVVEHPLQYVFGGGLFRIDRQRGRYQEQTV